MPRGGKRIGGGGVTMPIDGVPGAKGFQPISLLVLFRTNSRDLRPSLLARPPWTKSLNIIIFQSGSSMAPDSLQLHLECIVFATEARYSIKWGSHPFPTSY
jgi:hypothetical protein